MQLKFRITPQGKGLLRLGKELQCGKDCLTISQKTASSITVEMNPDMTVNQHKAALESVLSGCVADLVKQKEKDQPPTEFKKVSIPDIPLAEVDMETACFTGVPVWESLFCKPKAVYDLKAWADSEDYRKYVYLPNCSGQVGSRAEDFNSNSMYTLVMLKAYQNMCRKEGINPTVELKSGANFKVLSLTTFHGIDTVTEAERSAGLANSKLVDFDDSSFAKYYINEVINLDQDSYDNEPAKKTVLSKSELILSGKTSHKYNQIFVKRFFEMVELEYQQEFIDSFGADVADIQARVYSHLRSMIVEGLILEDNLEDFQARLWRAGLKEYVDLISVVYRRVVDEE